MVLPKQQLERLLDTTTGRGIVQHSRGSKPDLSHGYSLDDQARALIVIARVGGQFDTMGAEKKYMDYIDWAKRGDGLFHNFMDSRGNLIREREVSQDVFGRVIWSLAEVATSGLNQGIKIKADRMIRDRLKVAERLQWPMSKALTLIGLSHYLGEVYDDDIAVASETLGESLGADFDANSGDDWNWFTDEITYCAARFPHAMISAGDVLDLGVLGVRGLSALDFLIGKSFRNGYFNAVGEKGWFPKGGEMAVFDQQTVEAGAMVEACLAAYHSTGSKTYLNRAEETFRWYHGENIRNVQMIDGDSGGVYDAVTPQGRNENQGAESLLSYVMAKISLESESTEP